MSKILFLDDLKSMYTKSPIAHARQVKAPVYLMVGKNDLRVPPSQSYEFYNTLKGLGKEVYCMCAKTMLLVSRPFTIDVTSSGDFITITQA